MISNEGEKVFESLEEK